MKSKAPALSITQAAAIAPTLEFIDKHSLDKQQFYDALNLERFAIEDLRSYIPTRLIHDGLLHLRYEMGVDQPGLEVGKCFEWANWIYTRQSPGQSESLIESIRKSNEINNRLLTNHYSYHFLWIDQKPTFLIRTSNVSEASSEFSLVALTAYLREIRCIVGQSNTIDRISLPIPRSHGVEEYFSHFLPKNVEFNAARVSVTFDESAILETHLNTVNREVSCKLPPASLGPIHNMEDQLIKLLHGMNLQETPDLKSVSKLCDIHLRTLQRRLKESGQTFSTILEKVRYQKSEHYLNDPTIRITEIAHELGYNDSAHFSRAFKRWIGLSPKQYRQKMMQFK